jgi:hypothetical protein
MTPLPIQMPWCAPMAWSGEGPVGNDAFQNMVRLTPAQRDALLDQMDLPSAPARRSKQTARVHPRLRFRRSDIALIIHHPDRTESAFIVCSRNISAGGIALLHGGYVNRGAPCRVRLVERGGVTRWLTATAVNCRHVEKTLHEINIKFDQPINVADFVAPQDAAACAG